MKVMTIIGIRPDFIRMSLMLKMLNEVPDIEHIFCHTGQHFNYATDKVFFDELGIPQPDYSMKIGIRSKGTMEIISNLMLATDKAVKKFDPDVCLFLGDSNTALAAIPVARLGKKVVRIEAGMRSFDWRMPEEQTRTIMDHLSDYLYVYTSTYKDHLVKEGISETKIEVVGNPIVDVVEKYLDRALARKLLYDLVKENYILVTAHRAENVDNKETLEKILKALELLQITLKMPIVYPMYYRTKIRIKEMGLSIPRGIIISEPLGFLDFLNLEANAACLVTDSGTVQEEGCILKVPCVTMRISTERQETVRVGANILSGLEPENILECVEKMISSDRSWYNPLGDGKTSERIVDSLQNRAMHVMYDKYSHPVFDKDKQEVFSPYFQKKMLEEAEAQESIIAS